MNVGFVIDTTASFIKSMEAIYMLLRKLEDYFTKMQKNIHIDYFISYVDGNQPSLSKIKSFTDYKDLVSDFIEQQIVQGKEDYTIEAIELLISALQDDKTNILFVFTDRPLGKNTMAKHSAPLLNLVFVYCPEPRNVKYSFPMSKKQESSRIDYIRENNFQDVDELSRRINNAIAFLVNGVVWKD